MSINHCIFWFFLWNQSLCNLSAASMIDRMARMCNVYGQVSLAHKHITWTYTLVYPNCKPRIHNFSPTNRPTRRHIKYNIIFLTAPKSNILAKLKRYATPDWKQFSSMFLLKKPDNIVLLYFKSWLISSFVKKSCRDMQPLMFTQWFFLKFSYFRWWN